MTPSDPPHRPTTVDLPVAEIAELANQLPTRIDVDPETVQQDLARLVLTLVELLRRVVEHQAVRRMEDPDLSDEQVERMGTALLLLEEKMQEIRGVFGLAGEDLNVDLGPLGKLL
ncbi:MAG TPA: gas vesicle protein K [Longimicrobiaceae bacterium]|nr:gas vesicle protein K [Longimicrobiaceae bacterium]